MQILSYPEDSARPACQHGQLSAAGEAMSHTAVHEHTFRSMQNTVSSACSRPPSQYTVV